MSLESVKAILEYFLAFVGLYVGTFLILLYLQNLQNMKIKRRKIERYPLVSIVIPAYNEEKNIARAIKSVLHADYPKKQIILVDDGSEDRTFEIAESFRKDGLMIFRKSHSGKAGALNYGLHHAKGELIATLDADSFIAKDSLKKMMNYFDSEGVVAVTSSIKVWREKSIWQKLQKIEYLTMVIYRKLQSFLNSVTVTPGPLTIFRARLFKKIGNFEEGNLVEDQEFALRIQKGNLKIKSALDAIAYTSAPYNFLELLNQRLRWYRGTIRNLVKYRDLIGPKYGDFGIMFMPAVILTISIVFAVIFLLLYSIYKNSLNLFFFSPESFFTAIAPIQIAAFLIFFATLVFHYISIRHIQNEFVPFHALFGYLIFYTPILLFFWFLSVVQELFMWRLRW